MQASLNQAAKPKTDELYVKDIIKKQGVTVEVEVDCITYDSENGMILSWQLWSEHFNDWMDLNLDQVQEKWPTAFLRMQEKIYEQLELNKKAREQSKIENEIDLAKEGA